MNETYLHLAAVSSALASLVCFEIAIGGYSANKKVASLLGTVTLIASVVFGMLT